MGLLIGLHTHRLTLKHPPERFCKLEPNQQSSIARTISDELNALGINTNLGGVVDIAPLIESSKYLPYNAALVILKQPYRNAIKFF